MRPHLIFGLFLLYSSALAQNTSAAIDEQVWKPFIKAYTEMSNQAFMAVHSKDLIRVPRDSKRVMDFQQYSEANQKWNRNDNGTKETRTIELRFLERLLNEQLAYEVGIYKVTVVSEGGDKRKFYGKFHVVLRQENGVWKILVDADSSEGNSIGSDDFEAAMPLN